MRGLFTRIAGRYDALNRVLTCGLDVTWRRRALAWLAPPARVLDLATGTGDLALALARRFPRARVTGLDLTPAMLAVARRRAARAGVGRRVALVEGRADALPFPNGAFDAVTCAFGFRNFPDPKAALAEAARVLAPRRRASSRRAARSSSSSSSAPARASADGRRRRGCASSRRSPRAVRGRTTPTCAPRSRGCVRRRPSRRGRAPSASPPRMRRSSSPPAMPSPSARRAPDFALDFARAAVVHSSAEGKSAWKERRSSSSSSARASPPPRGRARPSPSALRRPRTRTGTVLSGWSFDPCVV